MCLSKKKTVTSLHILCFFLITVCAKEGLHCASVQCLTGTPRVYNYMLCVVFAMCIRNIGLSWWLKGKESACNAGDLGLIPEWGRSPGKGHGNPLQYSCLENPHGQRTLGSYPLGYKESDTTERLSIYLRDIECVWGRSVCWGCSGTEGLLYVRGICWGDVLVKKEGGICYMWWQYNVCSDYSGKSHTT